MHKSMHAQRFGHCRLLDLARFASKQLPRAPLKEWDNQCHAAN